MSELTDRIAAQTARVKSELESTESALQSVLSEHEARCATDVQRALERSRNCINREILTANAAIANDAADQIRTVLAQTTAAIDRAVTEARARETSALALWLRSWKWYALATLAAAILTLWGWTSGKKAIELQTQIGQYTNQLQTLKQMRQAGVNPRLSPEGLWIEIPPGAKPTTLANGTRWLLLPPSLPQQQKGR
jgi:DNA polymerase III delta prime subunit